MVLKNTRRLTPAAAACSANRSVPSVLVRRYCAAASVAVSCSICTRAAACTTTSTPDSRPDQSVLPSSVLMMCFVAPAQLGRRAALRPTSRTCHVCGVRASAWARCPPIKPEAPVIRQVGIPASRARAKTVSSTDTTAETAADRAAAVGTVLRAAPAASNPTAAPVATGLQKGARAVAAAGR